MPCLLLPLKLKTHTLTLLVASQVENFAAYFRQIYSSTKFYSYVKQIHDKGKALSASVVWLVSNSRTPAKRRIELQNVAGKYRI